MNRPLLSFLRRANRFTSDSRRLREVGIALYSSAVRLNVFLGPPRVVLNGPAKAGTHLLSDCLSLLPKMMFSGRHFELGEFIVRSAGERVDPVIAPLDPRLRRYLSRCRQGMFVTTHARYRPDLPVLFRELGFRHVFLLRDPRDMVVSFTHFVTEGRWLPHHRYYAEVLSTTDDRIMASITGFDDPHHGHLPSIGQLIDWFQPWLDVPDTLVCRFEDLVGVQGGAPAGSQLAAIRRVAEFVGRPITEDGARRVADAMYSRAGLTFRKGQVGDWRNHFSDAHRQAFKRVAGPQLVTLGYERDMAW